MDWLIVIFPIILAVWFIVYRINTQEKGAAWREAQKRNRIPFLQRIKWEIQRRQKRKRKRQEEIYLGKMPKEQGNIYVGNGRFGPYVEIRKIGISVERGELMKLGTDEQVRTLDTVTLEQAVYSIRRIRSRKVSHKKPEKDPFDYELPGRFGPDRKK